MRIRKIVRYTSPVALSIMLAACGGGGDGISNQASEPEKGAANGASEGTENPSSANAVTTVSGRVADGYIQGALVCVDLNENDSCDADEPSAVTGVGGIYDLEISADVQGKPIVADIPAEAIDEDTGEAVGQALVFIAPADKPEFLSPITTLVHQELRANPALDIDDAEQAVKSILGIDEADVSLFTDYVAEGDETNSNNEHAEKFRYLHDTARVVASLMKDIETQVETAAEAKGVDVAGSEDTQRAIREIVRSEVRELLPQIAQQVAEIVITNNTGDTSGVGSTESATEFDPEQVAHALSPVDAGENVEDRIDAVRDRVDATQSDMKQLLTDGVYWMEFDCNYDFEHEELTPVEGDFANNDYDVTTPDQVVGDIDYPMPECLARYGHVRLGDSGDTVVDDDYEYESETGGWVVDLDEGSSYSKNYSLVDGQWVSLKSIGPVGHVEFTDDGTAVITNDEGRMQLKAVTQEIGSTPVINHFWEADANPLWFDLVEPTDMFSSGSQAHMISVRQSSHPYTLFNFQPHDDHAREYCAQFNDNCNVVNTFVDEQHYVATTLDEIRDAASVGIDLLVHREGLGHDTLLKLVAEVPADGTMPVNGLVHWKNAFDGRYNESGELPQTGYEPGVDPYGSYPEGDHDLLECYEGANPDGEFYPELQPNGLPVDGQPPGTIYPTGNDETDADGSITEGLEGQDTGFQEVPGYPHEQGCAHLNAPTDSGPDSVDYPLQQPVDLVNNPDHKPLDPANYPDHEPLDPANYPDHEPVDPAIYPDLQPTDLENYPLPGGEHDRVLVSEWKLIEVQGVSMIEIQIPLILRHDTDTENGAAMLLIEHQGFVRMGARLRESFIERVITYNETAFTALRSIVETRINNSQ